MVESFQLDNDFVEKRRKDPMRLKMMILGVGLLIATLVAAFNGIYIALLLLVVEAWPLLFFLNSTLVHLSFFAIYHNGIMLQLPGDMLGRRVTAKANALRFTRSGDSLLLMVEGTIIEIREYQFEIKPIRKELEAMLKRNDIERNRWESEKLDAVPDHFEVDDGEAWKIYQPVAKLLPALKGYLKRRQWRPENVIEGGAQYKKGKFLAKSVSQMESHLVAKGDEMLAHIEQFLNPDKVPDGSADRPLMTD